MQYEAAKKAIPATVENIVELENYIDELSDLSYEESSFYEEEKSEDNIEDLIKNLES